MKKWKFSWNPEDFKKKNELSQKKENKNNDFSETEKEYNKLIEKIEELINEADEENKYTLVNSFHTYFEIYWTEYLSFDMCEFCGEEKEEYEEILNFLVCHDCVKKYGREEILQNLVKEEIDEEEIGEDYE